MQKTIKRNSILCALVLGVVLGQLAALLQLFGETPVHTAMTRPAEDVSYAVTVSTPKELQRALDQAQQGTVILLSGNMTLTEPLIISKNHMGIRLQAASETAVITAKSSRHFLCSGQNLDLLFEGVILDGGGSGGGIYTAVAGLSLSGVTIQNCMAGSGGGIEAVSGSLFIEDGTLIRENRATAYGGGIFTGQGVSMQIDGGTIQSNRAGAYGGGVFGGVGSSMRMDGGIVCENQAVLGGGFYAGLSNTLSLNGGDISFNRATGGGDGGRGGGVYAVTCDVIIDGSKLSANQAVHGGGIFATGDGSDIVLHQGSISENNVEGANAYGGGVYLDTAYSTANTLTVNGGSITGNHGVRGGGVFASGAVPAQGSNNPGGSRSARVTLNGGEVSDNAAGIGGGLYLDTGCTGYFTDGILKENSATHGGAVFVEPLDNLEVDSPVVFHSNRADIGVSSPTEEHIALHRQKIRTSSFTGSYQYGYNNHDIVYDSSLVEQQFHVVQFEYQGGTGTEVQRDVMHGAAAGSLPAPSREGYLFAGWYTASAGGEKVTSNTLINESLTLYAHWTANSYTITFDYRDTSPPSQEFEKKDVVYQEPVGFLPILGDNAGQAFTGWFDSEGKQYFPATIYKQVQDITLSAQWLKPQATQHHISFDYNGATGGVVESERFVPDGYPIGFLPDPILDGFVFGGWYEIETGRPWLSADPVFGDLALTARWEHPPYQITFDYMGLEDTGYETTRSVSRGQPLGELPQPFHSELNWLGWYADTTWSQPVTADTIPSSDITLYALFQGYIHFDYQGAIVDDNLPQRKPVAFGRKIGALPLPQQSGHFFTGWYTEPEGAGRYYGGGTSGKLFDRTDDLELYASWHGNTYTITFDYQGGSGSMANKQVVYADNIGKLPFPQREDYQFGGWFTQPDGNGEQFFVSTSYLYADDITLYASWRKDSPGGFGISQRPAGTRTASDLESAAQEPAPQPDGDNPDTGRPLPAWCRRKLW